MRARALTENYENEVLQKEFSEMIQHGEYINFMNDLESNDPKVRELFYNIAGNQMQALEAHHEDVSAIESEFRGLNEDQYGQELYEKYDTELKDMKNKKESFELYNEYAEKLTNKEDKKAFFLLLEDKFKAKDLYPEYRNYLRGDSGVDPKKSIKVSRREGVLTPYMEGKKVNAEKIYESLSKFGDPKEIRKETLNLSSQYVGVGGVPVAVNKEFPERTGWNTGRAMFGGTLGTDSPYYDAFYDSMDETLKGLVQEEDPWGPDWLFYGLPEEHAAEGVIKDRYGSEVYQEAYTIADEAGRKAQIKKINDELKKGTGENYQDLLRALDLIQKGQ